MSNKTEWDELSAESAEPKRKRHKAADRMETRSGVWWYALFAPDDDGEPISGWSSSSVNGRDGDSSVCFPARPRCAGSSGCAADVDHVKSDLTSIW